MILYDANGNPHDTVVIITPDGQPVSIFGSSTSDFKLVQSEDLGAGTKYILKSDGTGWLMIRKNYTDTLSTMAYAGPANNSGVTLAQAWGQRATLSYSATVGGV